MIDYKDKLSKLYPDSNIRNEYNLLESFQFPTARAILEVERLYLSIKKIPKGSDVTESITNFYNLLTFYLRKLKNTDHPEVEQNLQKMLATQQTISKLSIEEGIKYEVLFFFYRLHCYCFYLPLFLLL